MKLSKIDIIELLNKTSNVTEIIHLIDKAEKEEETEERERNEDEAYFRKLYDQKPYNTDTIQAEYKAAQEEKYGSYMNKVDHACDDKG